MSCTPQPRRKRPSYRSSHSSNTRLNNSDEHHHTYLVDAGPSGPHDLVKKQKGSHQCILGLARSQSKTRKRRQMLENSPPHLLLHDPCYASEYEASHGHSARKKRLQSVLQPRMPCNATALKWPLLNVLPVLGFFPVGPKTHISAATRTTSPQERPHPLCHRVAQSPAMRITDSRLRMTTSGMLRMAADAPNSVGVHDILQSTPFLARK